MITVIGDGGHAKVVRDVIANQAFALSGFIVAIGDNATRKRIAEERDDVSCKPLVHRSAIIAYDVQIGHGTVIMAGVIVQPGARIGKHCILNTGCSVDHDCIIEDYAHIAPGAHLCGGVHVGVGTLVGVGVGIAPNAVLPPWSLIKARRLEIESLPSN